MNCVIVVCLRFTLSSTFVVCFYLKIETVFYYLEYDVVHSFFFCNKFSPAIMVCALVWWPLLYYIVPIRARTVLLQDVLGSCFSSALWPVQAKVLGSFQSDGLNR